MMILTGNVPNVIIAIYMPCQFIDTKICERGLFMDVKEMIES